MIVAFPGHTRLLLVLYLKQIIVIFYFVLSISGGLLNLYLFDMCFVKCLVMPRRGKNSSSMRLITTRKALVCYARARDIDEMHENK